MSASQLECSISQGTKGVVRLDTEYLQHLKERMKHYATTKNEKELNYHTNNGDDDKRDYRTTDAHCRSIAHKHHD